MCLSFDGAFMFTAGGADLTVNMWALDLNLLQHPSSRGEPVEPFLDLLEGGKGGDLHNDIIEYFYYCQLKKQPDDSMDSWKMSGKEKLFRAANYLSSRRCVDASLCIFRSRRCGGRALSPARRGLLSF
jgi:hypothetical protein